MTMEGKKGLLKFFINNQQSNAPIEWEDINILATFDNESTQANITTDQFTFVREEAEAILDYIAQGLSGGSGIFEGLPFEIQQYNQNSIYNSFKGFLDLTNEFEYLQSQGRVKAKIIKESGLNSLQDRLSALSYGYLEDIGIFSDSDYTEIDYVVEKKINAFEILTSAVILYLMIKELAEAIRNLADAIANVVSKFAMYPTGAIGAIIYAVAIALITAAYTATLLIAVIELGNQLINTFVPPKRTNKVISLYLLIEKVCLYLGHVFTTSIDDLQEIYYLPSNPRLDDQNTQGFISVTKGTPSGIPYTTDYGYGCLDMFELVLSLFNAKIQIVSNIIHIRPINDPYWIQISTFQMPGVLALPIRYNTDELQANRIIAFETDLMDDWTIDNFQGTKYEVITDAVIINNVKAKYVKGLDSVRYAVSLGNRKDELNPFENFLAVVAGAIDSIGSFFGGNPGIADKIKNKVGLLKISTNNWTNPKLLRLKDGKLLTTHRENWSAKYLYENYYIGKSFVSNNYYGQKTVYKDIEIPFGFEDFLKLIDNSYFTTFDGKTGKVTRLDYNLGGDKATVDYWIREPYTKNLKETFIEPA